MKHIRGFFVTLFLTLALCAFGQETTEFEKLVKLGELYTTNVNATGDDFKREIEKLRSPGLNHIIDALIAVGSGDEKLVRHEFLSKPSEQELKYWYVLREIHYNNRSVNTNPRPNEQVAQETLESEIDSRWLLDNYYYRIRGGIAKMFNEKDLSKYNFDLNDYGLEGETEKAILYFAISTSLIQRFQVLQMMKKYDRLLEFADKLPSFNGKPYYTYTSFDFEDFQWIGYDKSESYKETHLENLYQALNAHLSALAEKKKTDELRNLYLESVLFMPNYFKYSGKLEKDLQELYDQANK
jgi:hypothetical protein